MLHQDKTIKNNDPQLLEKLIAKRDSYLEEYKLLIKERKIANVLGGLSVLEVNLKIQKCKNVVNKTRRRIREVGNASAKPVKSKKKTQGCLSRSEIMQNKKVDRAVDSLKIFWDFGVDD